MNNVNALNKHSNESVSYVGGAGVVVWKFSVVSRDADATRCNTETHVSDASPGHRGERGAVAGTTGK